MGDKFEGSLILELLSDLKRKIQVRNWIIVAQWAVLILAALALVAQ